MNECTVNKHNLDVMHLGCCTYCGGSRIVPAERPTPPEGKGYSLEDMEKAVEFGFRQCSAHGYIDLKEHGNFIASLPPQPVKDETKL